MSLRFEFQELQINPKKLELVSLSSNSCIFCSISMSSKRLKPLNQQYVRRVSIKYCIKFDFDKSSSNFSFWQPRLNGLGGSYTLIHVLKPTHYNLISWAKATVSIDFGFSHPWNRIMKLWWSLIIKDFGVTKTWCPQLNGHVNKEPSGPDTSAWFKLICCFRLAATKKDKLTCPEKHNSATDKKSVISQYFSQKGHLEAALSKPTLIKCHKR